MPSAAITTSAPGSLMLLGEHAVLHGFRALSGAINRRITLRLIQTAEDDVRIHSDLGIYRASLHELPDHPSFRFVLQAIRQHRSFLSSGFELRIDSEFPANIGLGSSAAVTVAVHAALAGWITDKQLESEPLFTESLETVRNVQGRGSGADLAASVHGGIVGYTAEPTFRPINIPLPLTAVYSGQKIFTSEMINRTEQARAASPKKFERIYSEIDLCVESAFRCLQNYDLEKLGAIFNRNQELMNEMDLNTPELRKIVAVLQADPAVFGAKISGSGLGDCAIGIGHANPDGLESCPVYHLEITPAGYKYHDITEL